MSKCLAKVKNVKILSVIVAVILAIAVAIGVVCNMQGGSVFNTSALLKDSNTLTVSMNQYAYLTKLEQVEEYCEEAFADVDVAYEMKGEMSGDESEIVYVFASETELDKAKAALETKFDTLLQGDWNGTFITIATNSEKAVEVLAKHYVLRGIIAAVVLAVLVCAYAIIRFGMNMGIATGISTVLGLALSAALAIITRVPVTASVAYAIALGGVLTAVMTVMSFSKMYAGKQEEGQSAEEYVASCVAVKEIVLLAALSGVAFILVGAIATATVRWFAILGLLAVVAATFIGLFYAPALYLPLKKVADKKPAKDGYIGAEKTSTKIKKIFVKKEKVVEKPVEVVEEPAEEVVEETAEEAPAEEPAEEVTEEVVEETTEAPVEETVEETPVEETPVEEVAEEVETEEPEKKEE